MPCSTTQSLTLQEKSPTPNNLKWPAGERAERADYMRDVLHWLPFPQRISYRTMQTCSFSVVGPKTWNGLPADLRHLPNGACSQFHHLLKTVLFRLAWVGSASE